MLKQEEEREIEQDDANKNIYHGQTMMNANYDQVVLDYLANTTEAIPTVTIAPTENKNPIPLCFDELAEAATGSFYGG